VVIRHVRVDALRGQTVIVPLPPVPLSPTAKRVRVLTVTGVAVLKHVLKVFFYFILLLTIIFIYFFI
jgi:hypothetical protein